MSNYVTNIIEIHAEGKALENILTAIRRDGDEYGSLDFNKLIPMPESLDLTKGSVTDDSVRAYISNLRDEIVTHPDRPGSLAEVKRYVSASEKILRGSFGLNTSVSQYMPPSEVAKQADRHNMTVASFLALGKKYLDNQLTYGSATWYDWCVDHWGCKWNTEDGSLLKDGSENVLQFDTAWSAPFPFMEALSKAFPDTKFFHSWADEDIGHNVGQMTLYGGAVVSEEIPEGGSKEAYELAFEILEIDPRESRLRYDVKEGTYVYDESLEERWDTDHSSTPPIDNVIDLAKKKTLLEAGQAQPLLGKDDPER